MDEALQYKAFEETTPELRNLQPPSTPSERSDTRQHMKGFTWPNGPEPEEVSLLTGTTSMPSTPPTAPERIGFGNLGLGFMETPEVGNDVTVYCIVNLLLMVQLKPC
jgi:hypothetical protein